MSDYTALAQQIILATGGDLKRLNEAASVIEASVASAQEAPQPVAWRTPMVSKDHYQLTSYADVAEQWRKNGATVEPLYAAPPTLPEGEHS